MNKTLEVIKALGIIALLILLFWFVFFKADRNNAELKEYWENKDFKTDTLIAKIDYTKLPKPILNYTIPPNKVIEYQPPAFNPKISVNLDDSLIRVIDSLKQELTEINLLYLELYPKAHKLIYATFTKDTINFDFLSTEGRIHSEVYPVNFSKFIYQYKNNHLSASNLYDRNKAKKDLHGSLFGYAGYGFVPRSPIIGLDYSLYMGNVRLGANSFITVQKSPEFTLNATLGYRLYGRD